jgi:hypothetical protein
MAKGKNKRKRQRAEQRLKSDAVPPSISENREMIIDETPAALRLSRKTQPEKSKSRFGRFVVYLRGNSSFTDWCIAAFTLALTIVGYQQYKILDGQLHVMRTEQRAWISTKPDLTHSSHFPLPSYPLLLTNTGKTPAIKIEGDFYIEVVRAGDAPHFNRRIIHNFTSLAILQPADTTPVPVYRERYKNGGNESESEPDFTTLTEKELLESGDAWIAIYGQLKYDDVFHRTHPIHFCLWEAVKPDHAPLDTTSCVAYNKIDEE